MVAAKSCFIAVAAAGGVAAAYYYYFVYLPKQKPAQGYPKFVNGYQAPFGAFTKSSILNADKNTQDKPEPEKAAADHIKEEFSVLNDPPPTEKQEDAKPVVADSPAQVQAKPEVEPILFQEEESPEPEKIEPVVLKDTNKEETSLSSAKNEDSMIIVNRDELSDEEE